MIPVHGFKQHIIVIMKLHINTLIIQFIYVSKLQICFSYLIISINHNVYFT